MSCNHKDIGALYLIAEIRAGIVGTSLGVITQFKLEQPRLTAGDQIYNIIVFKHSSTIILFMSGITFILYRSNFSTTFSRVKPPITMNMMELFCL